MYIASANRYETMKYNRGGSFFPRRHLHGCFGKNEITSVLIGASKLSQIVANIKAHENTVFTDEELKEIDSI